MAAATNPVLAMQAIQVNVIYISQPACSHLVKIIFDGYHLDYNVWFHL